MHHICAIVLLKTSCSATPTSARRTELTATLMNWLPRVAPRPRHRLIPFWRFAHYLDERVRQTPKDEEGRTVKGLKIATGSDVRRNHFEMFRGRFAKKSKSSHMRKTHVGVYFVLLVKAYVTLKHTPARDSVFLWKQNCRNVCMRQP